MQVLTYASLFCFIFCSFILQRKVLQATLEGQEESASSPPRGWNSYDSFSWTISEEEFLQNAEIVSKRLLNYGYQYVVVDYLWYRRRVEGAHPDSLGFDVIDEWGRMIPDPERWPSSKGGKGFTEVAQKVHAMGLKFGIHVMRGISTQAVNANTPIFDTFKGEAYNESGRQWRAQDIGIKERTCSWMSNGFMSLDTKFGAGKAFLRSLYEQYAEWGVDFVKHDCIFGDDLDLDEISIVSEILKEVGRPILYSLSPGSRATPIMAKDVSTHVNMYRVTSDDWDTWGDVASHFNVARDFAAANLIGAKGLQGKSWPDLDMLPLGWLTDPAANEGPHRKCYLSLNEQRTQMTLWSMAKSPLMFGGDLRKLDATTYSIITAPTLLEINSFSENNKEFPYATEKNGRGNALRTGKSGSPKDLHLFGFISCKDVKTTSWVNEFLDSGLQRFCWKNSFESNYKLPLCLYKTDPPLKQEKEVLHRYPYQEKFHLLESESAAFCLDASPRRKLTSRESKGRSLSPCSWHSSQMWQLNSNMTLVNSYSGLCTTVEPLKADVVDSGGVRSWVATGRKGEIYLSFFNLNPDKTVISAKISDLDKLLPDRNLTQASCTYSEVWNAKDYGVAKGTISLAVAMHGSALIILHCM